MVFFEKFALHKLQNDEVTDIIKHLNRLLNTKQGFGAWQKDFGIDDYSGMQARSSAIEAIMEDIKTNIEQYEPRVSIIDIKEQPSQNVFRLCFELQCTIHSNSQRLTIFFDSKDRRITIEDNSPKPQTSLKT